MIVTSSIITLLISVATGFVLDSNLYNPESLLYTADNDIVDIHLSSIDSLNNLVFIVEKKLPDGDFQGLYTLKTSETGNTWITTKELDNGQCITSDDSVLYIGASNGIYTYNTATKKAEKYGNITADIKAILKLAHNDVMYAIADNHLNKITENGTVMRKIESVNDVQEIVLDNDDNVYLYEKRDANAKKFEDKYSKPKVIVKDEVIAIKDLPDEYNQIRLIRTFMSSEGALLVLDNKLYRIFPNGTSMPTVYSFVNPPTAYFLNAGLIQLYAHDKKLYQFNFLGLLFQGIISAAGEFITS